jgi:hypothetical protein
MENIHKMLEQIMKRQSFVVVVVPVESQEYCVKLEHKLPLLGEKKAFQMSFLHKEQKKNKRRLM